MKIPQLFKPAVLVFLFFFLPITSKQLFPQTNTWQQLRERTYPEWFTNSKLGIFIHWGVYSVPAYSDAEQYAEWFLRGLQSGDSLRINFMRRHYGDDFTYRDFSRLWKAELFDADEWASLFSDAGANYIIFVAKHHDGFCLWPSQYAPGWNSMDLLGRDFVGELEEAVKKQGIRFGLYYSLPEWDHPLHRWYTDPHDSIHHYVRKHMVPQFKELVETYKPELLFADGEWFNHSDDWHARELISWYFDLLGNDAVVNDRWGEGSNIGFLTPEYSSGNLETDRPWVEVRGLGRSFALNRNEKLEAYKTPGELIRLFARTVSFGGGLAINVGPAADGQIPLLQQERLLELGNWIKTNNEAIHGAQKWNRSGEYKTVKLERIDPQIDFNWVRNSPGYPIAEDNFTASWEGYIKTETNGIHRFSAVADDGMRLYIDDKLVLDLWENEMEGADSEAMRDDNSPIFEGEIVLKAGHFYPIRLDYFETLQNAHISLFWEAPGKTAAIVPQQNFYTDKTIQTGNGLNAVYRSEKQYVAYTHNHGNLYAIAFEWPDEILALPIPPPKPGASVQLLGIDRELPWEYIDGKLLIDVSGLKYNEMPGHHTWTFRIEGVE